MAKPCLSMDTLQKQTAFLAVAFNLLLLSALHCKPSLKKVSSCLEILAASYGATFENEELGTVIEKG